MSVLQKFEKFALTKEQGNVIKGGVGVWQRCRNAAGSQVDVWLQLSGANGGNRYIKSDGQFSGAGAVYNCENAG